MVKYLVYIYTYGVLGVVRPLFIGNIVDGFKRIHDKHERFEIILRKTPVDIFQGSVILAFSGVKMMSCCVTWPLVFFDFHQKYQKSIIKNYWDDKDGKIPWCILNCQ